MSLDSGAGSVLVTGAGGHIGRELCQLLANAGLHFLPVDLDSQGSREMTHCDLRSPTEVARLFKQHPIWVVIHLAGVLPTAFQKDPLLGAETTISASVELMRQSAAARVKRFIFASSMSVYGTLPKPRPLTEDDPAAPDDPYGASKRTVELIGETLAKNGEFEFVALRIARVVGPGIKKTSSPWRGQIFEDPPKASTHLPFSPKATLSLVHVTEVAKAFQSVLRAPQVIDRVYNVPAETWELQQFKQMVECLRGIRVELDPAESHAGPTCDGSRFTREFGFQLRGLREYLEPLTRSYAADSDRNTR